MVEGARLEIVWAEMSRRFESSRFRQVKVIMTLEEVVQRLVKSFSPYSIFLYGSKATETDNEDSDYEVGVIFEDDKYISRRIIAEKVSAKDFAIYPFRLGEIMSYDIDTPFQKTIYLNVLANGGSKTLYGVPVLQSLAVPAITTEDLLADINFNLGVAFSAVRAYKEGDIDLANNLFYKACFFATRDLIYHRLNKLCLSYHEIYGTSQEISELDAYREVLDASYSLRNHRDATIASSMYYKNISYINQFILKEF